MAFKYTKDQKKVIETSEKNILVSAAAGSGKTAVLVERIIHMITINHVAIDRLLIVTFTNAAAQEMRQRIGNAIESAIDQCEDADLNRHLIKQMTLLPTANIMTMHSFCLKIIKSYYHLIGLDPTFRIGNETELVLLKEEVFEAMMEKEYEKAQPSFISLVEAFADGKNDDPLKDLIFTIYRFAMSNPWPEDWMDKSVAMLNFESLEDFYGSVHFKILKDSYMKEFNRVGILLATIYELMDMNEGPDKYMTTVESLSILHEDMMKHMDAKDYELVYKSWLNASIPPLSRKTKGYDKELAGQAKAIINEIKDIFKASYLITVNEKSFLDESKAISGLVQELVALTKRFKADFSAEKRDRNIIDFNDFEHFALELLYSQGKTSEIASIYREKFHEILVDEYQDTNEVQETILTSMTKDNNLFMVGDLKQSIYKFRLAKPEIFREKYDRFDYEEGINIKIDLGKNFRSRLEVLRFVNEIFEKVMTKNIGDVNYNEYAKLYHGSYDYPLADGRFIPEIIIAEREDTSESKVSIQGEIIAGKIKEMINDASFTIFDKDEGIFRPLAYKDICILMRSPSSAINDLKEVFDIHHVPYKTDVSKGFFQAVEVQIMMNLLKIIDNPYQDIPLVSVLRSAIVGLNEGDLLKVQNFSETKDYYDGVLNYIEAYPSLDGKINDETARKLHEFLDQLEKLRSLSLHVSIYELIETIYTETGYTYYVKFMENGQQRMTNLLYLQEQAKAFEQSSYKGLFNFIRYIDHIKKYEIDMAEPISDDRDTGVTFLSIHKSKGLEFPVVFVMDIHKEFNVRDLRKSFMIHQELGFASDYINPELRLKKESKSIQAIKLLAKGEIISEEMRLFYVALTRAREKLFLIGVTKSWDKLEEKREKYYSYIKQVPEVEVTKAMSYLDFVLMAVPEDQAFAKYESYNRKEEESKKASLNMLVKEVNKSKIDLLLKAQECQEFSDLKKMEETYHHIEATKKYMSMSVSELKESQSRQQFKAEDYMMEIRIDGDLKADVMKDSLITSELIPQFIAKEEKVLKGAEYGLLMHKILSLLPVKENYDFQALKSYVDALHDQEIIEEAYRGKVYIKPLLEWTKSPVFKRIIAAHDKGQLYREKSFVLAIHEGEDLRMIQGVIDLYFEEDKHLILLDYKTDYVKEGQEEVLLNRYKVQLDYYKKALEDITDKVVSEVYIYSLSLGKLIKL